MKNASNTLLLSNTWFPSAATDEAHRVVECVAAVPALMDAVSAPFKQSTLRKSQSCGVSQPPLVGSFRLHQTVDPDWVCRVHVEQAVVAGRIRQIARATVVWSQVIMRALPQVQVLQSVEVHVVESVPVVPKDREAKVVEPHHS